MSGIPRVSPEEVKALLEEGYVYVDVRTVEEFGVGHVPGAFNVPIRQRGPSGMADNPDFLGVMERRFGKGDRLIVGCQSGVRSRRAADLLARAGYTGLHEFPAGWDGARDAFGRLEPGWSRKGFPVETAAQPGRGYAELVKG